MIARTRTISREDADAVLIMQQADADVMSILADLGNCALVGKLDATFAVIRETIEEINNWPDDKPVTAMKYARWMKTAAESAYSLAQASDAGGGEIRLTKDGRPACSLPDPDALKHAARAALRCGLLLNPARLSSPVLAFLLVQEIMTLAAAALEIPDVASQFDSRSRTLARVCRDTLEIADEMCGDHDA